jgi:hypothetical protein
VSVAWASDQFVLDSLKALKGCWFSIFPNFPIREIDPQHFPDATWY